MPQVRRANMPASTFAYLRERHAFWPTFRGIAISGEIKMMKPEREIFEYLLDRFDLAPAETVLVDDHQPNIEAAQAIGLHTVLFRDARQCELELEPLLAAERRSQLADSMSELVVVATASAGTRVFP
jgi:FMN phosphatase YigB (HAD superfamily)